MLRWRHMNARERIEAVLRHEHPGKVPFVLYAEVLPRSKLERALRNRGRAVVVQH